MATQTFLTPVSKRTLTVQSLDDSISGNTHILLDKARVRRANRLQQSVQQQQNQNPSTRSTRSNASLLDKDEKTSVSVRTNSGGENGEAKDADSRCSNTSKRVNDFFAWVKGSKEDSEPGQLTVTFDKVMIRDYPITIGDNPTVSDGAPLTIGWDYFAEEEIIIDKYEEEREGDRRFHLEMKMPAMIRFEILQRQGYTPTEISKGAQQAKAERLRRLQTSQMLYRATSDERKEKMTRGIRNFFGKKGKNRDRQFLKTSLTLGKKQREEARRKAQMENSQDGFVYPSSDASSMGSARSTTDIHPYAIGSFIEVIFMQQQKKSDLKYANEGGLKIYLAEIVEQASYRDFQTNATRWKYLVSYRDINVEEWLVDLTRIVSPPSVGNKKVAKISNNSKSPIGVVIDVEDEAKA